MSDPDFALRYSRAQGYYVPIYQASRPRRRRMGRTLLWLVLLAGASWVLTGCGRPSFNLEIPANGTCSMWPCEGTYCWTCTSGCAQDRATAL